jgi:hypothetical protein
MTTEQLEQLAHELVNADCICDTSAVLSALSDDELQAAYDDILKQFGLELVIGACDGSDWVGENLVIAANEGSISFLQVAFYAVRLERQRRKAANLGERLVDCFSLLGNG